MFCLHGNTGKYFRTLFGIALLGMAFLAAGCRDDLESVPRGGELAIGEDLWPIGDGSSWCNVMEAGFNSPELPSREWLAEASVLSLPAEQEFDTGSSPIVAGLAGRIGFSKLMKLDGPTGADLHIALRDRFWVGGTSCLSINPLVKGPSGKGRKHFTRGGAGRGVGHFGYLSHRYFWVYY